MTHYHEDLEVGGRDAIDTQVMPSPHVAAGHLSRLFRTRAALGLRPLAAPAVVFVPIGVAMGPHGLGLIAGDVLHALGIALPIALAALGIFIGLGLQVRRERELSLLIAANAESTLTIAVVGLATWWLLRHWGLPLAHDGGTVALALGVAAAASAAGHVDSDDGPLSGGATRIADFDDLVPLVAGGYALAVIRHDYLAAAGFTLLTCLLGLLVAIAGWLLFDRAHGPAERGVFVLGAVALAGGAPAFLGLSPLLSGLVAGLFWTYAPGRADRIIRDDLRRLQHPLVVILLVTAGASLTLSLEALWLSAPFVAFRIAGKLAGGWIGARLAAGLAPADLGAWLLRPGLIGVAFALSVGTAFGGQTGAAILSAAVLGTLASEIVAMIAAPARAPA